MTKPSGSLQKAMSQLTSCGFLRRGTTLIRANKEVATCISVSRGFGTQEHVDVGFTLVEFRKSLPSKPSEADMYFRLERLVPSCREAIALAGNSGEPGHSDALDALARLLPTKIDDRLRELESINGLRTALMAGELDNGLIRKEARQLLQS